MIGGVYESMTVFQEEIFGPVLVATPFEDEADAVRLANATPYGLAAYVWTNDVRRAHRVAHAINTGMCWINSQNVRDLRTPFGGTKQSGIGREGGDYAFEFYCDTEIVHVALGTHHIPRLGAARRGRRMSAAIERLLAAAAGPRSVRRPALRLRGAARDATSRRPSTSTSICSASSSASARRDALYLRGWEERAHHSLVLRAAPRRRVRAAGLPRARARRTSTRSAREFERARVRRSRDARRAARDGTRGARVGPLRLPARVLLRDVPVRDPAAALQHPARRADHAPGPLQHPLARTASGRWRSGSSWGSAHRVHLDRRRGRADHRRLARAQADRARHRAHRGGRARGCTTSACTSPSRPACCAPATSSAGAFRTDAIERGPGRHGVSNAFFVYLRDPDGHRIELYACDYYTGDPDHRPLRWSVNDPRCRSFYGTRAPDSWYEESSVVLGPNGEPVTVRESSVDERLAWSEVMA